jgi:hypothetical protein
MNLALRRVLLIFHRAAVRLERETVEINEGQLPGIGSKPAATPVIVLGVLPPNSCPLFPVQERCYVLAAVPSIGED